MYFGKHEIKDVEFWFSFDGEILTLFPMDEKNKRAAMELTHRKIGEGSFAFPGDPTDVDPYLVLLTQDEKRTLVLYPVSTCYEVENFSGNTLHLQIGSWFLADSPFEVSGLSLTSTVLDHAYDIQWAVDYSNLNSDGKIEVASTRKEGLSFRFRYSDIDIEGYLSHSRGVCYNRGELPIKIRSQLSLSFPETSDVAFLFELMRMMHGFLSFLAQGHNCECDEVQLLSRYEYDEIFYLSACAEYHESRRDYDQPIPKRILSIGDSADLPQCAFRALANKTLSLEHLPSVSEKNSYSVSRLIMMLAALDNALAIVYADGIKHSEKAVESKRIIKEALDSLLVDGVKGRVKSDVKWLKGILNDAETLHARMGQFGKDHKELFGHLNGSVFSSHQKRTAFFGRITKARNKIAHGDFDIFDDFSFEDIEGTNRLLLSAQLVSIGMKNDVEIASIVNKAY